MLSLSLTMKMMKMTMMRKKHWNEMSVQPIIIRNGLQISERTWKRKLSIFIPYEEMSLKDIMPKKR